MTDDADDPSSRAAILARRATFIATALGLTLPVVGAGCSDPQPCLKVGPSRPASVLPADSATAPSATASATSSASAATPAPPPTIAQRNDGFAITAADAQKLGLPALGMSAKMTKGGWTLFAADASSYAGASGPPGGPLSFRARPYRDGKATLQALFEKALSDSSGLDPIVAGGTAKVTVGGRNLEAQAFRTGQRLATTNWCVVKAPTKDGAPEGALLLFGTGSNEQTKPNCEQTLKHEAIAEIIASLAFETAK